MTEHEVILDLINANDGVMSSSLLIRELVIVGYASLDSVRLILNAYHDGVIALGNVTPSGYVHFLIHDPTAHTFDLTPERVRLARRFAQPGGDNVALVAVV